ncbi:MAG: glycoside hydrolase family 88 protein [Pseudomonadota bacterium]
MMVRKCALLAALAALAAGSAVASETFDIGLAANGARIDAISVAADRDSAPFVVLVGGLKGDDATAAAVRAAVQTYEKHRGKPVRLLAVPVVNPAGVALEFPPKGVAYREQAESHVLWRWLGAQAPDLVLIAGEEDSGLVAALGAQKVADMGSIPAQRWSGETDQIAKLGTIGKSAARIEFERRSARSPKQLAVELSQHYGRDFEQPLYIGAIALVARLKLGHLDEVKKLVEPFVDGSKDSLTRPSSLIMAGHIVFTELARRTDDPRYAALVRKVGDLGFDTSGQMRESMPYHDGYSDSVFMGTAIVAQAGALTGERKYFDMADRHLRFMETLDLRPDGLYRHRNTVDAAWGRGNGFAAIGLAMTLTELPRNHPGYTHALESYRRLMAALLPLQTRDGLWRNVVDHPGAFAEFSGTAMIGFAMQRGLKQGWLSGHQYQRAVDHAWLAVNSRTSSAGTMIDVCESTAGLTTVDQYLQRAAILGQDPRGGAMAMLFATELMEK